MASKVQLPEIKAKKYFLEKPGGQWLDIGAFIASFAAEYDPDKEYSEGEFALFPDKVMRFDGEEWEDVTDILNNLGGGGGGGEGGTSGTISHNSLSNRNSSGAHNASAINVTDSAGYFEQSTVEKVLAEIGERLAAVEEELDDIDELVGDGVEE